MDLKEVVCEAGNLIDLDRNQWRTCAKAVMDFRVPRKPVSCKGELYTVKLCAQWDKGFMPYDEFNYNIYIENTLIWCHFETFETQRLISRNLACVEWRNNGFCWAKIIGNVPLWAIYYLLLSIINVPYFLVVILSYINKFLRLLNWI